MSGLLIGCAATSPSQNVEELAARSAPRHLRHEARLHSLDHDHPVRKLALTMADTHVSKPTPTMMAASIDGINCTSIPLGAERALCLDRQSKVDVRALRGATVTGDPSKDTVGDVMKVEDEKLSRRLKNICRGC